MKPRCRVTLTLQERDHLAALSKDASTHAERFLYARALLLCDQEGPQGPNWTVAHVPPGARRCHANHRTLEAALR